MIPYTCWFFADKLSLCPMSVKVRGREAISMVSEVTSCNLENGKFQFLCYVSGKDKDTES